MKRMLTAYIQNSKTKSERLLHEQTIKLQPDNVRKIGLLTWEKVKTIELINSSPQRWSVFFSYWALKNHGDSLLLFHHVKILAKVRCHIPLSQVIWIIFINSIEISLFMRGCCWRWWGHHRRTRITIHSTALWNLKRTKMSKLNKKIMENSVSISCCREKVQIHLQLEWPPKLKSPVSAIE